jgi:RimJ/RimL family protein N-acetyltransferase
VTRVERISVATEKAALEYLSAKPAENVFISFLLRFDLSSTTRNRIFVLLEGGAVRGLAYFARQVVLACDPESVAPFARESHKHMGERMLVGPRATVEAYWELVRAWHPPPRLVRERQFLMAVDRARLQPYDHSVTVRHARPDEWTTVADNSAAMIDGELDYDPRSRSAAFSSNVRRMIDDNLWWVGESLGRLCFFCNIGPWCPKTAQLQGIWTPPEYRGRGLASSALGAICDRLLNDIPQLSLYVNDFNVPAIALYRRIGFETLGEFRTLLF